MGPEWIVVGIVAVVVLFGAKKIPEMARSLGRAQSEFKKGVSEGASEADAADPPEQSAKRPEPRTESTE